MVKEWCQNEWAQIINTSWALLALMAAEYPDREVIDRGVKVPPLPFFCDHLLRSLLLPALYRSLVVPALVPLCPPLRSS